MAPKEKTSEKASEPGKLQRLLRTPGCHVLAILLVLYLIAPQTRLEGLAAFWKDFVLDPTVRFVGTDRAPFVLFVVATQVLHLCTFWAHCLVLLFLDLNLASLPSVFKWKVQKDKNVPLERDKLMTCIRAVLFNQVVVNSVLAVTMFRLFSSRRLAIEPEALPSPKIFFRDLAVFLVVEEIGFYYGHRVLHSPLLYKWIHKQHHEWTAPIGCACIYANPIEHVIANLLPVVMGPIIMKSHLLTYWVWLTLAVFTTITHHSGYHFPFLSSPEFHDYHHLKFNYNFGVLEILDLFHETDSMFVGTVQEQRNYVFTSFSAADSDMAPVRTSPSPSSSSSSSQTSKQK